MKNIHLLSTGKPSQLFNYIERPDKFFLDLKRERIPVSTAVHKNIYITSDEEIKEGNWVYHSILNSVFKLDLREVTQDYIDEGKNIKKIILTTDQDLIKDGVQSIPDEFLEWFIKNPNCEYVEIDDLTDYNYEPDYKFYGIIIPKEEPKQETLEEVAEKIADNFEEPNFKAGVIYGVIEGAKWQQERMYSEEDLKYAFDSGRVRLTFDNKRPFVFQDYTEWKKQFKKK